MRKTVVMVAGLTLASATALALQETGTQDEYDTQTTDPYQSEQDKYGAQVGEQSSHDLTQMSAEELSGMTVTTEEGEELGTIEDVGYSATHQDKVATINVGGFLGVGEKLIAVPLSELQMGSDDSLVTRMSREEIESQPEFDPADLSTEEQSQSQQDW